MPVARPESSDSRIIAHVDMDCFYVQVEQRKQPELRGLPTAVVQYNEWKGGALIAVGYEARKFGVTRHMRGDEAKEICPQIHLVQVPVARGKADLNTYRNAGSEVVSILSRKGRCERASIDEVYLDLTDSAEAMLMETPPESLEQVYEEALKSHILGLQNENGKDAKENVREWICGSAADHRDKLLACGVLIVAELRMQVLKETEFTCSAGIAHNKMFAKLASGMNKPAQQTVVPSSSIKGLLDSLPIKKMKQLGGKLGTSLQNDLGVNVVGDLVKFSEEKLQNLYGVNTGTWLWNIARGISGEEVQGRLLPKSHGSGKSFPGPRALKTIASVQHWLNQLCEELSERICLDMDQNKRIARTLTLHASAYKSSGMDSHKKFPSKSCPLRYGSSKIQEDAFNLFQAGLREYLGSYGVKTQGSNHNKWGITSLSVSASKIVDIPFESGSILKYFHGQDAPLSPAKQTQDNFIQEAVSVSPAGSESHSEMTSTSTQVEHDIPCLGRQEHKRTVWNYQDASCSSPKQAEEDIAKQTSHVCASGNDNCSAANQINSPKGSFGDDVSITSSTSGRQKHKTNSFKDKGTILKFFKSRDSSSSSMQEIGRTDPGRDMGAGSMYVGDGFPETKQCEQPKDENIPGASRMNEENAQGGAWSYNADEIDPSVIDELPREIQNEIRAWLWPHKQRSIVKRGSSIAHYFLPAKKHMS